MKFQVGDLLYVANPEEYILIIGAVKERKKHDFIGGEYPVFSLTENKRDYYNVVWVDKYAIKVE